MKTLLNFVNSKHIDNYKNLLKKFTGKLTQDMEVVLKLLSIDEVYNISKDYIDEFGIKFSDLLNDYRVNNTSLFICQLAYSLFCKSFKIDAISSTRKLDNDTRNFIINILYLYTPSPQKLCS